MIYLASPYSDPDPDVMQQRYELTMRATALLISRGLHVLSPIVYGHEMAKQYDLPTDAKWWAQFNSKLLRNATDIYILHLDGWDKSVGVKAEWRIAVELFIHISHINEVGDIL